LASGKTVVIDGHSHAPVAVSKKNVTKTQQRRGYRACTIPSTPATLGFAQGRYGLLSGLKVMQPAIRLAEHGYPITKLQHRQMHWCRKDLTASPVAAKLFLKDGRPLAVGEIFRQRELAVTLRHLAMYGVDDFYRGELAAIIAEDMKRHGGLITREDLANFSSPVEREPLKIDYRGYRVLSVPPPGGGLQVLLGLKLLEQFAPDELSDQADYWYGILAEVTHAVFRQRSRLLLRPQDLSPSLCRSLLSEQRAAAIAHSIRNPRRPIASEPNRAQPSETTHLCTVDNQGNVVSLTQSIQSLFGAKVANEQLGFLYNNYLRTCPRRPHPYQLRGSCMPRSNAGPTLVLGDGSSGGTASATTDSNNRKPFLVLGAAGSRRITSSILQVISGVLDRRLSLGRAVDAPRVHVSLSGKTNIERSAATAALVDRLKHRFSRFKFASRHSYFMGAVQAIQFQKDGTRIGAADPRRDGTAGGLQRQSVSNLEDGNP
jgi:gamma-glutamyltranspeptidase/glutathione hydrolase